MFFVKFPPHTFIFSLIAYPFTMIPVGKTFLAATIFIQLGHNFQELYTPVCQMSD